MPVPSFFHRHYFHVLFKRIHWMVQHLVLSKKTVNVPLSKFHQQSNKYDLLNKVLVCDLHQHTDLMVFSYWVVQSKMSDHCSLQVKISQTLWKFKWAYIRTLVCAFGNLYDNNVPLSIGLVLYIALNLNNICICIVYLYWLIHTINLVKEEVKVN